MAIHFWGFMLMAQNLDDSIRRIGFSIGKNPNIQARHILGDRLIPLAPWSLVGFYM